MCTPVVADISKSIVSLLRQLAGIPQNEDSNNISMPDATPSQMAYKVFMLISDLIHILKKTDPVSDQYDAIKNIINLSLGALIDSLNNHDGSLASTVIDNISEKSYLESIEILIEANLFETKGNLIIAKGLIFA